jgi:hypothetical protein
MNQCARKEFVQVMLGVDMRTREGTPAAASRYTEKPEMQIECTSAPNLLLPAPFQRNPLSPVAWSCQENRVVGSFDQILLAKPVLVRIGGVY